MRNQFRHHHVFSRDFFICTEYGCKTVFYKNDKVIDLISPEQIKNTQSGICYLLASGPSLQEIDFSVVKQHPTFCMNGSISILKNTKKKTTYYAVDDSDFFDHRMNFVLEGLSDADLCFFSSEGLLAICMYDPKLLTDKKIILLERVNRLVGQPIKSRFRFGMKNLFNSNFIYKTYNILSSEFGRVGFSTNISKGVFGARSILYHSLQIAYHLGFRDLYMAGADYSNCSNNPKRFYESGTNTRPTSLDKDYHKHILPSFKTIQKMIKKEKLTLTNLSVNSRIPGSIIPKTSNKLLVNCVES